MVHDEFDRQCSSGRVHSFSLERLGPEKYTGENGGPVLEAVWPSRFVFQWKSDSGLSVTTVEMDFTPVEDGTVVRLQEGGFQDSPEGMQDLLNRSAGWGEALTLMKFFVEHGIRY